MSEKKVLVTAGSEGIGAEIVKHYAPHSLGISRRTGHDIRVVEDRKKILDLSLQYDVFVNHAFAGDSSQADLLDELAHCWVTNKKSGLIVTTGTYGTYIPHAIDPAYIALKTKVDETHKKWTHKIEAQDLPFRMSLLRPGTLDTRRSRNKAHWRGNGVKAEMFFSIIDFLWNLPNDVQIPDIVIESIIKGNDLAE